MKEKNQLAEKATVDLTGVRLSLKWWRGGGGDLRVVSWVAEGGMGNDVEVGEKRGFDDVFREEVDLR